MTFGTRARILIPSMEGLLILGLCVPMLVLLKSEPFQRGFFCDDQNLMHQKKHETISVKMCGLVWVMIGTFVVVPTEVLFLKGNQHGLISRPTKPDKWQAICNSGIDVGTFKKNKASAVTSVITFDRPYHLIPLWFKNNFPHVIQAKMRENLQAITLENISMPTANIFALLALQFHLYYIYVYVENFLKQQQKYFLPRFV